MKKLLILGFIISCAFTLMACEHTHKNGEYGYDGQYHWYKCTSSECEEQLEKAEHAWGDGEVTTKPTSGADGVKTYLCTACKQIKQEPVKYVPGTTVTKEKWENAFRPSNLDNVTAVIEDSIAENKTVYTIQGNGSVVYAVIVSYKDDAEVGYIAKYQESNLVWTFSSREETIEDVSVSMSADLMSTRNTLANYRLELGAMYESFEYNSETACYEGKDICVEGSLFKYKSISVKMGDGLIYEIVAQTDEAQPQSLVITFSQYGKTVPTPPIKNAE